MFCPKKCRFCWGVEQKKDWMEKTEVKIKGEKMFEIRVGRLSAHGIVPDGHKPLPPSINSLWPPALLPSFLSIFPSFLQRLLLGIHLRIWTKMNFSFFSPLLLWPLTPPMPFPKSTHTPLNWADSLPRWVALFPIFSPPQPPFHRKGKWGGGAIVHTTKRSHQRKAVKSLRDAAARKRGFSQRVVCPAPFERLIAVFPSFSLCLGERGSALEPCRETPGRAHNNTRKPLTNSSYWRKRRMRGSPKTRNVTLLLITP